VVVGNRVGGRS